MCASTLSAQPHERSTRWDRRRRADPDPWRSNPTGPPHPCPPTRCFPAACSAGSRGRLGPGPIRAQSIRRGSRVYQVYALKCGERDTTACEFFYREPSHERITLDFFVWLILGGPHPVLVDTGFGEEDARARGLRGYVSPAAMVSRLGVQPEEIPMALVTHLHWDHWAGYRHFPGAEFWIQQAEVAFWTGPVARYDAYRMSAQPAALAELVRLNYASRVRLVRGDREILPGLHVHRVGGHTAGLQIVSVETAKGRIVLTSDASPFYRNVERFQPVQIITSLPEMLAGFETIHALAGARERIVAGHDPEVASRFETVEPGIIRIA